MIKINKIKKKKDTNNNRIIFKNKIILNNFKKNLKINFL